MAATTTYDFDVIGQADGTPVTAAHFATTQALELFINTSNLATWETDSDGVKYINVPKNARLLLRFYSSTVANASTYMGTHIGGLMHLLASGETWPSSDVGKEFVDTSAGTDRIQIKHRGFQQSSISNENLIRYDLAITNASALTSIYGNQLVTDPFAYVPVGRKTSFGYGCVDSASGGVGVWVDGHLTQAANGDTTGVTLTDFYDFDVQPDTFQDVRIYGPIKVWHTTNDFRDEPEFVPDYSRGDFKDGRRPITDEVFPRYDITVSGTPSFGAAVQFQSSGNSFNRSRAVISGSSSESMTFTLKDEHAFTPATKNGRLPFVFDCIYLPGSASQLFTLDVGEANPLRILWDGSAGTSTTRQIKVDPCTGSFGSAITTYDQSKRYWCAVILDNSGGSLIMVDETTAGHTTNLLRGGALGYSGVPTGDLTPSVRVTVGSTGSPEFAGLSQIDQIDSMLVSSWVASDPQGVDGDSPGAALVVTTNISVMGDKFPLAGFSQTAEIDSSYTFGHSGRAITNMNTVLGGDDFVTFMSLFRGQRLVVAEWTANNSHNAAVIIPAVETMVAAAAAQNVELIWVFQPPIDDSPASDQDLVRSCNAQALAVLQQYAGQTVIWTADLASLYSDAQAAALSTDNVHPTSAGYAELGALVEPNMLRLASPSGMRSRDRSRER